MSDPKSRAAELKAAGNAAFSSGDFNQSISLFTEAISLCPDDHVFYSNRSGAYASINQYEKALEDAEKCVELNPAFIKGYSRKGLALFQLGRVDDAKNAYQAGLEKDPQNAQLKEGLAQIEESQKAPPAASNPFGQMFGPSMWSKLMQDPVTKQHLNDPAFVKKMQDIQKNPDTFGSYASDPKVSQALGVLFNLGANAFSGRAGADGATAEDFDAMADEEEAEEIHAKSSAKPAQQSTSQPKKPEPVAKSPEATEAEKLKNDGNTAFKARKFDEAIALYEKAAALDATSIVYLNNIAACHYEKKDWDACVAAANRAIEVGREHMASYKDIAKAWMRIGNARYAEKKWKEAVDAYEKSNIEDYTDKAKEQIKKCNAHLKKEAELAYLDEGKSEEEKNKGNALFSDGKYIDAITHYTEALKRNPNNYKVYSNRAACYTKLMDWQRGLDDCEACLKADPKFVKAYIRKAKIQHFLKQYHKALETYEAGLAIDPQSSELLDGRRLTLQAINAGESDPEAQKARAAEAMKDPEIQQILRDPTINKVLTDMQDNPAAGQAALRDKDIKAKIEKLIAAGVLQVK